MDGGSVSIANVGEEKGVTRDVCGTASMGEPRERIEGDKALREKNRGPRVAREEIKREGISQRTPFHRQESG